MNAPTRLALRTERALAALAIDPGGLKGLCLRARVGPARLSFETALAHLPGIQHRIHPNLSDEQLFGGLNIAASLAEGRPVHSNGLNATSCTLVLTMAERCPPGLAARLAQLLDAESGHSLILLDEGAEPEEIAPPTLLDRLAFHIEPAESALPVRLPAAADIDAARSTLEHIHLPKDAAELLTVLAMRFGVDSLRAPQLALRTARALAALDRERCVTQQHLQEAAELVFPARATRFPQDEAPPEDNAAPPDPPPQETEADGDGSGRGDLPDDILVQAVAALLPSDLLDRKSARKSRVAAAGTGAGDARKSNRRGRPLPSRQGKPSMTARIDPVATLRAAAPWQTLRRTDANADRPVIVYPSDIRIRRFEERSDRLLIFTVDASGSAAVARLAEAKGAVELMLAHAYAKRDLVALIAFRGAGSELLLQPTRSLVQAKRQLSALPGGGGTPLADGLLAAAELTQHARGRGMTPTLVLLTDGRANITLSGEPGRTKATEDAETTARLLVEKSVDTVLIDTSNRPAEAAKQLAKGLNATYFALPRADAHGIASAVQSALEP